MQWLTALSEVKAEGLHEAGSLRPAWATQQDPISTKKLKTKTPYRCGGIHPVLATQEAEAGGLLEPRSLRLQ